MLYGERQNRRGWAEQVERSKLAAVFMLKYQPSLNSAVCIYINVHRSVADFSTLKMSVSLFVFTKS